ncbi:hypothetical protein E2C01_050961 [Portunus trituberculatus]|uniref:Uncharacterized protein n=1 Tax=Portunus trituberculatus TaxID=210409 RepID=A0A5B7GHT5_PORTR|nr:hypothetical protein [Portunus trituberculatus]
MVHAGEEIKVSLPPFLLQHVFPSPGCMMCRKTSFVAVTTTTSFDRSCGFRYSVSLQHRFSGAE